MDRFDQKRVLITGAASGIGRATALRIAAEGASVALLDIDRKGLESVAELISKQGRQVHFEVCDVSSFEAVQKAIDELAAKLGGLEILSHNAGILRCYNTHEMTEKEWNEIIGINLSGTFNVNRHALRHLLKNPKSAIVNTSSIAAYYRHPWMSAYSATKGAIKSFTRSLFIEYCMQGLRANCVLPGSIDTPLARSFFYSQRGKPRSFKKFNPFWDSHPCLL